MQLRPIFPGGQPSADTVVGRDQDITRLWNCLLAGSCLLNEPRRIGKSSVLVRMAAGVKPPRWQFLKSSVQGVASTDDFAALVLIEIGRHRSLTAKVKHGVTGFLEEVEATAGVGGTSLRLRGAFRQSPLQALESALAAVTDHLADDDMYLVIAWDEFPDAVVSIIDNEGTEAAAALLGTLRRFREQYPDRIRWLLTGSVGLHHALRRLDGADHLVNDLQAVPLGPLGQEPAHYLAGCLLLGVGAQFDDSTLTAMVQESDGIPYLLHLLAKRVRDFGPPVVAAGDVPELFVRAVGDLDASHQSTHLLTRLGHYYAPDTQAAEQVLDYVAGTPTSREDLVAATSLDGELVRKLVQLLVRDHYIELGDANTYRWRYDSLRRIWMQRRAM